MREVKCSTFFITTVAISATILTMMYTITKGVYYKDVITFIPNNFRGKIRMPFQFHKLKNKDGIPDFNAL